MTMIPVRFTIDDDLWQSFTVEQVTKQIRRLRETGRFWSPNHGSPFVVRVSQYALMGGNPMDITQRDMWVQQGHPNVSRTEDAQSFFDYSFEGDDDALTDITVVTRRREIGSLNWTTQHRQEYERAVREDLRKEEIIRIWWEKDYVCTRVRVPQDEWKDRPQHPIMAANVVVILLQDRTANKIEIEPKKQSKLRLNFIKRRPQIPDTENLPEIVLTIPRRVYTATGTGKPHGPHRMHYRAEHIRRQPYGPGRKNYKEIEIAGTWINASDVSPEDLGTPITERYYRFKALKETS
jgi:hypothetical protein